MSCCDGATADAVRTPHLDAFAGSGVRFRQAYHAGSPCGAICSPSRAMLHSGRGPFDIPAGMVGHPMGAAYDGPSEAATLGQTLRKAGYVTHFVGKWHNDRPTFERSFDHASSMFEGGMADHFNMPVQDYRDGVYHRANTLGVHSTDRFAASARAFLRDYASGQYGDKPFCLIVAFTAPHDPRRTHAQWHKRYPINAIRLPENFAPRHAFDQGEVDIRDELLIPLPRQTDQTRREISDYYAMTEHVDHAVGQIHETLSSHGLSENTLVAHTADHGLAVGQHGLMGKQNLYEHSARVPLVLAGPNVPAGEIRDQLVYQHDLFPTLLECAGLEPPERCAFLSLWPAINGDSTEVRDGIGSYYRDQQRMFRRGNRKLIAYTLRGKTRFQQFDVVGDPWEQNVELHTAEDVDHDLLAGLGDWQRAMGDPLVGTIN